MEYAKRTDANQSPIVAELRAVLPEATVHPTSRAADGFPDLAIGLWGHTYLIEVKTGKGKLTKAQAKFHLQWQGTKPSAPPPLRFSPASSDTSTNYDGTTRIWRHGGASLATGQVDEAQ